MESVIDHYLRLDGVTFGLWFGLLFLFWFAPKLGVPVSRVPSALAQMSLVGLLIATAKGTRAISSFLIGAIFLWEYFRPRVHLQPQSPTQVRSMNYYVIRRLINLSVFPLMVAAKGTVVPWFALYELPIWLQSLIFVLAMDFKQYWIHRGQHYFEYWWRFHIVHHSPRELSFVTGAHTHLLEFYFVQWSSGAIIFILGGFSWWVGLAWLIWGVLGGEWAHANIDFPRKRTALSLFISSPNFHALHHAKSQKAVNFSEAFPIWDIIFGTFEWPKDARNTSFGVNDVYFSNSKMSILKQQRFPWAERHS